MKKLLAIVTVVVFFIAVSAPVYSTDVKSPVVVNVDEEKPKTAENKKEAKKDKQKAADCQTKEKKSDCSTKKSKTCGDKGK
ncbi:MAG: hypothetical protein ACOCZL_06425 [Bacteroidota bacterium]